MSSTALVTFLFQAPRPVARVELLGSWDNFSKPYPMQRDRSLGNLNWRGCHSFTDITFDDIQANAAKRDGALKMGGTYWYFYRLDDDSECHNPAEPVTSSCPLLPGQYVNMLEVPVQYACSGTGPASKLMSALEELAFTLDPTDKFVTPQPPSPKKPKCLRLKTRKTEAVHEDDFDGVKFARLAKAAWANLHFKRDSITQQRPRSQRAKTSEPDCMWPWRPEDDSNRRLCYSADARVSNWSLKLRSASGPKGDNESYEPMPHSGNAETYNHQLLGQRSGPATLPGTDEAYSAGMETFDPSVHRYPIVQILSAEERSGSSDSLPSHPIPENTNHHRPLSGDSHCLSLRSQPETLAEKLHDPECPSATSSKRTSVFSLLESMTGLTNSPEHRQSQPITPSVSEFGEVVLDAFKLDDTPNEDMYPVETVRHRNAFSGYSLPAAEYASTITLRAAPSPSSRKRLGESVFENTQRVEKWDDGGDQPQKSALQDLVDEMGYLSSLIG